ncbi:DUF7537 family lipoprotein [Halobacterium yunchengense]|uniref:DUF7537 family lipoprotein n=1 Tax=Halobacterium yunchengense TaxID=3108497 RepID=UPI003008BE6F
MRKQIAAVAVVALLLVAGCSTGGDGSATTTAPEATTAAPGDATTTASGGDGGDGGDGSAVYETPLDAATVADNHEAVLREAGTFTLESTSNQTQGEQSFGVTSSVAADLSSGAYLSTQDAQGRTVETYGYGNGTAYQRLTLSENETQYAVPQQTTNTSQLASGQIQQFVNGFSFEHVGAETVDGEETDVYEADGFGDLNRSAPGFEDFSEENVSSVTARLYITEDGLVKQFSYELTAQTETGEATIRLDQRYVDVGSTDVAEPDWLDEARESTGE